MYGSINVIIANRNRDSYLNICLYYLNLANSDKQYKVNVLVISDVPSKVNKFSNLNIKSILIPVLFSETFNKAKLLNYGLSVMPQSFAFFSIIYVVMIYDKNEINTIIKR